MLKRQGKAPKTKFHLDDLRSGTMINECAAMLARRTSSFMQEVSVGAPQPLDSICFSGLGRSEAGHLTTTLRWTFKGILLPSISTTRSFNSPLRQAMIGTLQAALALAAEVASSIAEKFGG